MGQCEVIKAKIVAFDEIFHFTTGPLDVKPNIGNLRGATVDIASAQARVCVLQCDNFRCENNKITGTITFAICEDFSIRVGSTLKPVEFFFKVTRDFSFQKSNCTGSTIDVNSNCTNSVIDISSLECQIERVSGTNTITIKDADTFTQNVEVEVKIIAEIEKQLCIALCENTGNVTIVPPPTATLITTEG